MPGDILDQLQRRCAALPLGPVAEVATVERLLAACWHEFGGDDGGMESYKLLSRIEAVAWNQPTLSFRIERHGELAMGGTRDDYSTQKFFLTAPINQVDKFMKDDMPGKIMSGEVVYMRPDNPEPPTHGPTMWECGPSDDVPTKSNN